jgi:hypothetical protein
MWVFYGVLPALVLIALIAGGVALLLRGRDGGWNIEFSGVLLAYTAVAMLVGVFLFAAGAALLLKAGMAEAVDRDFSYNAQPYQHYDYDPVNDAPGSPRLVDPSDAAIRDDIASGIALAFAGGVVFAVHGFASMILRRRGAQGEQVVVRSYNLVGLAAASIGFLAAGAAAINDTVRRYLVGGDDIDAWMIRHPGEPLAIAIVLLPLVLWFGWRVWQEMGGAGDAFAPQRSPQPTDALNAV